MASMWHSRCMAQCIGTTVGNTRCERSAKRNGWCGVCKGPRISSIYSQPVVPAGAVTQAVASAASQPGNMDLLTPGLAASVSALHETCGVPFDDKTTLDSMMSRDNCITLGHLDDLAEVTVSVRRLVDDSLTEARPASSGSVVFSPECQRAIEALFLRCGIRGERTHLAFEHLTDERIGCATTEKLEALRDCAERLENTVKYDIYMALHSENADRESQHGTLSEWLRVSFRDAADLDEELDDIVFHAIGANDVSALRHQVVTDIALRAYEYQRGEPLSEETAWGLGEDISERIMWNRKAIEDQAAIAGSDLAEIRAAEAGELLIKARAGTCSRNVIEQELADTVQALAGCTLTSSEAAELTAEIMEDHLPSM